MTRLGYVVDRTDARDWRLAFAHERVLGEAPPVPRRVSWLDRCAPVREQPAQNCVNEALARAVHTTAAIAGAPIAYPSCLANYAVGRQIDEGPDARSLADAGSRPRLVMQGARQFGMVPLEAYDDARDPHAPVPFGVLVDGWHAKLTEFYRVLDGEEELLCAAIAAGRIPIFGRRVGEDYLNLGTEVYDGRRSSVVGGHMEAIVGYNLDASLPYFEVIGSWGAGFANGGISLNSMRSLMVEAGDIYVITVAPRIA